MRKILSILLIFGLISACRGKKISNRNDFVISKGQIPNIAKDKDDNIYLVYGYGDSIMYCHSLDNGKSFSSPALISVIPGVYSFATRGPQITITDHGLIVTACTSTGDIFSFRKEGTNWEPGGKVNDVDQVAKEGLMALSADRDTAYTVWLDLRGTKRNKIYGARTIDGGKTWSKNISIYSSPDSSVCECCKPSVIVKGNDVYVMFRNWLKGNRDLYLIHSTDGGNTFGEAQKLGNGSWQLNGCPMDGGAIALKGDTLETVWRREGKIFTATPGMPEKEIGEGHNCTLEIVNGKNVYAWTENGDIVYLNSKRQKKYLGEGSQPLLKELNNEQVICVWENNREIHASVLEL
jgi:hypothetical protein